MRFYAPVCVPHERFKLPLPLRCLVERVFLALPGFFPVGCPLHFLQLLIRIAALADAWNKDVVQLIKIKRVEQLVDPCSDSIGLLIINEPRARSVHGWLHGQVYGQRRHYLLRCLFDLFVFPIDLHTTTVIEFFCSFMK